MASVKPVLALLSALLAFQGGLALLAGDAQERLMKEASSQLLELNEEMLKGLKLKPEELEGRKVFARAHVLERPDGAKEIKVDELSLSEPGKASKQALPAGESLYIKGTVQPQPGRVWKLSIDDVLPSEAGKAGAQEAGKNSPNEGKGK